MGIGERIKSARRGAGLTQAQLAKAVGVAQGTVSDWEKDKQQPVREKVPVISKALQVSVAWLEGIDAAPAAAAIAEPSAPYQSLETTIDHAIREAIDRNLGPVVEILAKAVRTYVRQSLGESATDDNPARPATARPPLADRLP